MGANPVDGSVLREMTSECEANKRGSLNILGNEGMKEITQAAPNHTNRTHDEEFVQVLDMTLV